MPSYRLYCLNGAGKIETAEWIEADSDDDALEQARRRDGPHACEIWDRQRLVGRVEPYPG